MRHLLAYLVFVGLPLAGLYGVLHVGQRIAAPMAIHGSYAVVPMAPSAFACYAYLLGGADSSVTVAQSGRQVVVTPDGVALGPQRRGDPLGLARARPGVGDEDVGPILSAAALVSGTLLRHLAALRPMFGPARS